MTDRSISMYIYLRIHDDELYKTRFKTYTNTLLTSEALAVTTFGFNMNFKHVSPRNFQFRPNFIKNRSFSQYSQDSLFTTETARFQILTAVGLRKQVLWHVDQCRWVTGSRRFDRSHLKTQRHAPADFNPHPSGSFFLPPVNSSSESEQLLLTLFNVSI